MIQENGRGALANETRGIPPLDLTEMQGVSIPAEYEIDMVLGDTLLCELVDENSTGEVNRNGIWIKQEVTTKMWRVAKVSKVGPQCSGNIKIDDYIMYPSDRGLPMIRTNKKYIFLNESRVFCTCKPL
jgi:hypothetical protein